MHQTGRIILTACRPEEKLKNWRFPTLDNFFFNQAKSGLNLSGIFHACLVAPSAPIANEFIIHQVTLPN